MAVFQIELWCSIADKRYLYFEAEEDYIIRACEELERAAVTIPRVMVREYNSAKRKRVNKGVEFSIKLTRVKAVLSNGTIISEEWYQPGVWK